MSDAMKIPTLRAARPAAVPKYVAMPRFRRAPKTAMSLTEAVHRVLVRTHANLQPFGVFVVGGRLVISNVDTDRFKTLRRRCPSSFIAIYGPGLKIADALDDLSEHFKDEVADGVA